MAANDLRNCLCDQLLGESADKCDYTTAYLCRYQRSLNAATEFRIGDTAISYEQSVAHAARVLLNSAAPAIEGIHLLGIQAQQAAVDLATTTKSQLLISRDVGVCHDGYSTATFGEVASRSELVISINCDLETEHPRLAKILNKNSVAITHLVYRQEKFSLDEKFASSEAGHINEVLCAIELLLNETKSHSSPAKLLMSFSGWAMDSARRILKRMTACEYVTFVIAEAAPCRFSSFVDQLFALSKKLHSVVKCVVLNLGEPANGHGVTNVLAWNTGFASSADFCEDVPSELVGGESDPSLPDARLRFLLPTDEACENTSLTVGIDSKRTVGAALAITNLTPLPDDFLRFDDAIYSIELDVIKHRRTSQNALRWLVDVRERCLVETA